MILCIILEQPKLSAYLIFGAYSNKGPCSGDTVVLGRTLCAYGRVIWTETDTKDVFCVVDFLPSSDGLSRRPISKQVSVLSCH